MRITAFTIYYSSPHHHNLLDGAELAIRHALVPPTQTVFADLGEGWVNQREGVIMRFGVVRTQGDPFAIIDEAFYPHAIMPMPSEADADPIEIPRFGCWRFLPRLAPRSGHARRSCRGNSSPKQDGRLRSQGNKKLSWQCLLQRTSFKFIFRLQPYPGRGKRFHDRANIIFVKLCSASLMG